MAETPEQTEIILAPIDRHIKVAAVAGSGKSYTLIRRIRHLIDSGVPADAILVLMFNKSAKLDFSKRIQAAIPDGPWPQVLTYHGLGTKVCREIDKRQQETGWKLEAKEYVQRELAKRALKEAQDAIAPTGKQPHNQLVDEFSGFVDLVKSLASTTTKVIASGNYESRAELFPDAYKRYEAIRKESKIRFFADLIYDPICYIVAKKCSFTSMLGKFSHVIVDEYQDINLSSHILIDGICSNDTKLTVVGDDDQTIYEFRGSNPSFLISIFQERFKNPLCFTLTRTFRYGHAVSLLSNNVIKNNQSRIPKICVSSETAPPTAISMHFEQANGMEIANVIDARKKDGFDLVQMVVLLRAFSSAPALEITLLENEIPYHIDGHETVTQSREIKFLTALVLYAQGRLDMMSHYEAVGALSFLFSMPMVGIKGELGKDVATEMVAGGDGRAAIARHASTMHEFTKTLVQERLSIIASMKQTGADKTPLEMIEWYLHKTGYYESLKKASGNDNKSDEMEQTIAAWANFVTTCGEPDQLVAMMRFQSIKPADPENSLLITSVHRSKGLEWPVVILPDVRQNVFPYKPKSKDFSIESERRLFYVACTRAQKNLSIITAIDHNYIKALREGKTLAPVMDEKSTGFASVFLYEANIGLTGRVVASLRTGTPDRVLAAGEVDVSTFNEYLNIIKSPIKVERDLTA